MWIHKAEDNEIPTEVKYKSKIYYLFEGYLSPKEAWDKAIEMKKRTAGNKYLVMKFRVKENFNEQKDVHCVYFSKIIRMFNTI